MTLNDERQTISLDRLPVGQLAVVVGIVAVDADLERLKIMGLCENAPVHILRTGSRMVVCVRGTRLGLSSTIASAVVVEIRAIEDA